MFIEDWTKDLMEAHQGLLPNHFKVLLIKKIIYLFLGMKLFKI
jgi:hypothetical protein